MLYEAYRPWREMFGLPYVDLEDYTAQLMVRFSQIRFVPLLAAGRLRVNL